MANIGFIDRNVKTENERPEIGTASKYNGGQVYKRPEPAPKYWFNCDWFEVTTLGAFYDFAITKDPPETLTFDDNNIRLELTGNGGKHYRAKYVAFVSDEGQPFAQVLTAPRPGGVLKPGYSQVKVLNHALYAENWPSKFKYLVAALGTKINNVTRLDVSCDGHGFYGFLANVDAGLYKQVGRARFTTHKENGRPVFYEWGRRGSDKSLVVYNKSKSLERENKEYISDTWARAGLDTSKDVERLEGRFKAKAIDRLLIADYSTGEVIETGVNISKLEDQKYLAGILRTQFKRWFEFRLPTDKNISRCPSVSPIDWTKVKTIKMERLTTTKQPSETWHAKRTVTMFHNEKGKDYIPDAIKNLIERELKPVIGPYKIPDQFYFKFTDAIIEAIVNEFSINRWYNKKKLASEQKQERNLEHLVTAPSGAPAVI